MIKKKKKKGFTHRIFSDSHFSTLPCLHTAGRKELQRPEKTKENLRFLQSEWCKRKSAFSCTVDALDHGGALVGQSWGLLIYTFHKIIHVQGIPLPIWLGRTQGGGGGWNWSPVQNQSNRQWRGLVSIYANMHTAINRSSFGSATRRGAVIN